MFLLLGINAARQHYKDQIADCQQIIGNLEDGVRLGNEETWDSRHPDAVKTGLMKYVAIADQGYGHQGQQGDTRQQGVLHVVLLQPP